MTEIKIVLHSFKKAEKRWKILKLAMENNGIRLRTVVDGIWVFHFPDDRDAFLFHQKLVTIKPDGGYQHGTS